MGRSKFLGNFLIKVLLFPTIQLWQVHLVKGVTSWGKIKWVCVGRGFLLVGA